MEHSQFIEWLGNKVILSYNKYKILPSLIIAQGILESGWGNTELAREYCNYFGLKWYNDSICKPYGAVNMNTKEEYEIGHVVSVNAPFCMFDNVEQSIECLCRWYTERTKYKELIGCTDYRRACTIVKECGYATDSGYTNKLIRLIEGYNLKKFDDMVLSPTKGWYVQVGYYEDYNNVVAIVERLKADGYPVYVKAKE